MGLLRPRYNLGPCVAWDLGALFSVAGGAGVDVRPRSFDVYSSVFRDRLNPDHRVSIRFDATFADADGHPDELAAFSASAGWTPHVGLLSGTPWDFVRFEVEFDIDVSGDGWDPLERLRSSTSSRSRWTCGTDGRPRHGRGARAGHRPARALFHGADILAQEGLRDLRYASMKGSISPSRTFWTLPSSSFVR